MTTQISIGRNVGDELELTEERWEDFKSDLDALFSKIDARITGRSWSAEWGGEESYSVVGACEPAALDYFLALLADKYHQDAIAVADSVRLVVP